MQSIISVTNLSKTYKSGFTALKNVNLQIREREIFALLGPNGAGKTTLISIICGIVNASEGSVSVAGYDIVRDYRKTRSLIGSPRVNRKIIEQTTARPCDLANLLCCASSLDRLML